MATSDVHLGETMLHKRGVGGYREMPFRVWASAGELFGILTQPNCERSDIVMILLSGQSHPATNRNRTWVRLARALAVRGISSIRFDYGGVGESGGEFRGFQLNSPFVDDLQTICVWAQARGFARFVTVGTCFGAQTALYCPFDPGTLLGAVLLSPPVADSDRSDSSHVPPPSQFILRLREVIAAGTSVMVVFSRTEPDLTALEQTDEALASLIGEGKLEVSVTDYPIHGFLSIEAQEYAIDLVEKWVRSNLASIGSAVGESTNETR